MMKKILIALLFSTPLWADGPQFVRPSDGAVYPEMQLNYYEHKFPHFVTAIGSSITVKTATASTGTFTSLSVVTSTITNLTVSGTAVGTFGKVVQWVSTTSAVGFGTTSNAFVQTNLRGQITGVSASNKVLICATGDLGHTAVDQCTYMTIARNGTNLLGGTTALIRTCSPATAVLGNDGFTACYVDPAPAAGTNNYSVYIKVSGANSGSLDTVDTDFMLMMELKT